jgi:cysteinyl-tRNA synthetase
MVHNTLSRKKEPFLPLHPGEVKMYVCGITPYDLCHIGHARATLVFDTVKKYLEYRGYRVTMVRNFTDIDDKIISRAAALGVSWREVSDRFIQEYQKDMQALGLRSATVEPRATDHIQDMIEMIRVLEAKGYAYAVEGDVYFEVSKFPPYGKLSGRDPGQMLAGARVEIDARKRHPLDFALWKSSKEGEPSWESPWGRGRPGWHIECSVMAMKYLGETLDIHGGGADLIFPHHENEIAQSEAYSGKEFARYWLHNGFVSVESEKMSKSLGNFFTIREALAKYDAEALKLFLLSTHYRSPLDFSEKRMKEAQKALNRARATLQKAEEAAAGAEGHSEHGLSTELFSLLEEKERAFVEAMDDDFHTPRAIGVLFEGIRHLNGYLNEGVRDPALASMARRIRDLAGVLGVLQQEGEVNFVADEEKVEVSWEDYGAARDRIEISWREGEDARPEDIRTVLLWRGVARAKKDWESSDEIRNWMKERGIHIEDTREGYYWRRIPR